MSGVSRVLEDTLRDVTLT